MAKAKKRSWSYSTGERGANRVRAYEHGARGLFLEWFAVESVGGPRKRLRVALTSADRDAAKGKADDLAARLRRAEPPKPREMTLAQLFDIYEREVTPSKVEVTQGHDRRARELFLRAFGSDRKPMTLSQREWDRYIADRRSGRLAPPGAEANTAVRDRIVQQDLRLLLAILNWATRSSNGHGGVLLDRNPLKGLVVPREENPMRPVLSPEQYAAVRAEARARSPWLECFAILAWETGHRGANIRQLRWSDVDLEKRRIHWRGDVDKIDYDHWNPLTDEAVNALRSEQTRAGAIGDAWVFPSGRNPAQPRSRDAMSNLWKRIAIPAGIPKGKRYGWHACRRGFASELREVPLRDLKDLGGWKTAQTILTCYQQSDEGAQRSALARRSAVS